MFERYKKNKHICKKDETKTFNLCIKRKKQ